MLLCCCWISFERVCCHRSSTRECIHHHSQACCPACGSKKSCKLRCLVYSPGHRHNWLQVFPDLTPGRAFMWGTILAVYAVGAASYGVARAAGVTSVRFSQALSATCPLCARMVGCGVPVGFGCARHGSHPVVCCAICTSMVSTCSCLRQHVAPMSCVAVWGQSMQCSMALGTA